MSHFGKALGSRSRGRSVSRSRHTAWKMSAASSYRPSLMRIEKIRFLYLSTRADQAFSSPCRHSATRRSSGQEARLSRCIFAATVTGFRLFFFFSSRRRHTRCYRDWSSDVCSSDLWAAITVSVPDSDLGFENGAQPVVQPDGTLVVVYDLAAGGSHYADPAANQIQAVRSTDGGRTRSEERRVGKEGTAGGRGSAEGN